MSSTESLARELKAPVLVLGASGFIGANLMHALSATRTDVYGTASREPAWRLKSLPADRLITVDLLARGNLSALLDRVLPATVFDCVAYGAYSFEHDIERWVDPGLWRAVSTSWCCSISRQCGATGAT